MKKSLSALLVAAMTITMLAGCGTKYDETSHNLNDINVDEYVLSMGDYKGLELSATKEVITDEYINEYIDNMLENNKEQKEVTGRAVKEGDVANIDFAGKVDGVAFDGGSGQGTDLTIGSGTFIPGFEDGVIGMNTGDTKDIEVTFPEDYPKTELAGKAAVFTVTVNKISELYKAELTDDYVKSLEMDNCNDVASFKAQVKTALENYAESTYQSDLQQAAVNGLIAKCKFADNPPEALIEFCKQELSLSFENQLAQMNLTLDDYLKDYGNITKEQYDAQLTEGAKSSANLKMACMKVAKEEKLSVTDEELDADIEQNYASLGYESADDYKKNGSPEDYRDFLLLNKVKEFLVSNAVISDASQATGAADTTAETTQAATETEETTAETTSAAE